MSTCATPLHVLVVDDDPDLCQLLADYLGLNGFVVETVGDGAALREALARRLPDVIVLDLMLPGEDGLSLVRAVKARWAVPILMLSARGEEMDRVIGLEVGADDYMAKPFGPRELLARVRALVRRQAQPHGQSDDPGAAGVADGSGLVPGPTVAGAVAAAGEPPAGRLRFGPFALDTAGRRLLHADAEVVLTTAEFELLAVLVARPNRVLSRDTLVSLLKGCDRDAFDRSIDNRVTRLRRKLEDDPAAPAYIRTVRGEGYWFNPQGGER